MKNNNQAIVRKITQRTLSADKRRNFFIITAIALTTLLLAFVFSVGMSVIESYNMQQIRFMGTVAHAAITRPSAEELTQLKSLDYVKAVGTGNYVASINNTQEMGDMILSLYFFDKTEWEESRSPAYTDIVGKYPQKENEIMVPYWIFERMGIEPEIGMEIPLSYSVETDDMYTQYDDTFILSGWFTSYMHIRSGNIDSILVSEEFSLKYGKTSESDGSATVIFTSNADVYELCGQMEVDLNISDSERIRTVPIYDDMGSGITSSLVAFAVITAFLVFTGYLLIYNVLYISVERNVRFYGLLKTIGTTPNQIRRVVTRQIMQLCAVGIPIGAILSLLTSLAVIPSLVSLMSGDNTGTVVSFSPLIYVGAAVFALLTAFLGASTPAKKAAGISPIEAQKYTGTEISKKSARPFSHSKPYRMALRNIFRDKKRAVVVFLSLFLGVTTFITITTLVSSMDVNNYIESYIENDFLLTNNTFYSSESQPKQKFDDEFLLKINNTPGLKSMQYDTLEYFSLTYEECFDDYLNVILWQMYGSVIDDISEVPPEGIAAIKENFNCFAVGIDSSFLSELDGNYDIEAFERGEYVLLSTHIDSSSLDAVESVEIRSFTDGSVLKTIPVIGIAPRFFHNSSYMTAPTIIISNNLMEQLSERSVRSKLYIDVEKGYDSQFLEALKSMTDGDYEISRTSKLEMQDEMHSMKMLLYILGGGIAFVLGLIGVLNFVNVMSVSVMVRKRELAALESVGMSRKQVRKLLIGEGLGYGVITILLVLSAGNAVTYGVFKLFQQQADYAIFTYPFVPAIAVIIIILAICFVTPEIAYRGINKMTLVERLREAE